MSALSFDILGRDKASQAFDKVSRSADRTEKKFGFLAARTGGLTAGMTAGFGKIAGAMVAVASVQVFKGFIEEARESRKVAALSEQIIKSTGGAAKISAKQVGALATSISNKTGVDDEAIQSGSNLLLTFKNVRNEVGKGAKIFDRATAAAVDLSAAGFGDVNSASKMLGKALNDPLKGLTALGKAGVTFTEDQKKQIKTLVETGDVLSAQKIILQEVESQVGGAAAAAADPMAKLGVIIGNVKETIGTAFLPMIDKAATWLGDRLPGAVDKAGKFFKEKLLPPLKTVSTFVQDRVIPVAANIVSTFAGLGERIVSAIGKINLGGIADDIWTGASKWASSLIGGLKTGIQTGDWKPLGTAIGEGVISALKSVGTLAGKIFDALGNLIDKVDWGKLGKKTSDGLSAAFKAVDWGKLGGSVGSALIDAIVKAKDLGKKFGDAFKTFMDAVDWEKIGNDSTNAIGKFISGIDWGQLGKVLGLAVLGSLKINVSIKNIITAAAADLVTGMFKVITAKIEEGRLWVVAKMKELGLYLWSGLKSGVVAGAKGIGGWLKSTIVDPVVSSVKSFFGVRSPSTVFAGIGRELIAGLKGGIAGAARGIGTWMYRTVISPVVGAFSRAGTWLVQHGKNAVAGFKNGVVTIATGIGKWIYTKVISPLVAPFMKAGTWLNSAGRNVIAGFKNGMVEIWKDVTTWVGGIATWIKDHKGPISLDGRLLIPAGRAIMSGFLKGLKSGAGPAWNFVKSVGGKTVDMLRNEAVLPADIAAGVLGGPNRRVFYQGEALDLGTYNKLATAMKSVGGINVTQGSYEPRTSYSGSTHMGGGVFDVVGGNLSRILSGLKSSGLIGWIRNPSQGNWPWHIHALDPGQVSRMSASARGQVADYYRGGNGLAGYLKGTPWVPNDQVAFLHKGEAVIPPEVNRRMRAAKPAGGSTTVVLEFRSDGSPHMDYLIKEFRKYVRVNGGDVQKVLSR